MQQHRVYTTVTVRRRDVSTSRLLRVQTHHFLPFCDTVPKLGSMQMVFVKSGTEIDDAYYQDKLLMELLPSTQSTTDEVYIFQPCTPNSGATLL